MQTDSKFPKIFDFVSHFIEYLESMTFLLLCLVLQQSEGEDGYISKLMKFWATKPFHRWVRFMDYMANEPPLCV